MPQRSWLFVPGDSAAKLARAADAGADAVVIDLEDSVAPDRKEPARRLALDWLAAHPPGAGGPAAWVRINPLDSPWWRDDLAAVMPGEPRGIMLPKAAGVDDLHLLAVALRELEHANGLRGASTLIVPLLAETPGAALAIAAYADAAEPRLHALTWGAEDLAAALGARRTRDAGGEWTDVFSAVRAHLLLAAHARGVPALDAVFADFRDLDTLRRVAEAAHADGFSGMLAIHPGQVPVINAAFTPDAEAIAEARAIVAAFAADPAAGVLAVGGRMVDRPHLERARRLLDRSA